jgi:hypothetical protein
MYGEVTMSAAPKIIEGTWDEVVQRASELAGHRLLVTVLDPVTPGVSSDSADAWVHRLYEWARNRPPVPTVFDDSRDSIYSDRLDQQL